MPVLRKKHVVSVERLRELLEYDPKTGIFKWRKRRHKPGRTRKDLIAGTRHNQGYQTISVDWGRYLAHRLAWLYVYGEWADEPYEIDHINRNRRDNRIANLRKVTRSENCHNSSMSSKNTSGYRGVSYCTRNKVWRAEVRINNQIFPLGYFSSALDGHNARLAFLAKRNAK